MFKTTFVKSGPKFSNTCSSFQITPAFYNWCAFCCSLRYTIEKWRIFEYYRMPTTKTKTNFKVITIKSNMVTIKFLFSTYYVTNWCAFYCTCSRAIEKDNIQRLSGYQGGNTNGWLLACGVIDIILAHWNFSLWITVHIHIINLHTWVRYMNKSLYG